jgi:cobalt-zinc-cadmium efflux system membrane fusion protein
MNRIYKVIALVACVMTLSGCKNASEQTEAAIEVAVSENSIELSESQYQNLSPELTDMKLMPFSSEIEVTGMVDVPPENIAKVSSAINGMVKTITHNVLPGKYVKKGAVLAVAHSMELVQIEQDYLEAFLKNEVLSQELKRQKKLSDDGAGIVKQLEEAISNLKLNEARVNGLAAKLKIANVNIEKVRNGEIKPELYIFAPLSGFVKEVYVNTGSNFSSSDILFELISKEHLHVELKVFEKDAANLKTGQKVLFDSPKPMVGEVFLIAKSFDQNSRSINVHVHFKQESYEADLIPGQYLKGKIQIEDKMTNALPESALIRSEKGIFVLIKNAEKPSFEKVKVDIGLTKNSLVEILSPIKLENVITSQVHLISGMIGAE